MNAKGNINSVNEKLYKEFSEQHTKDGGHHPDAYAITELIKSAIINKDYKIYYGGGYEHKTNEPIKVYDVVVWFNLGGDAFFQVCLECDDDCCVLYNSNDECTFEKNIL